MNTKFIVILIILLSFSCSSSDDSIVSTNENSFFNPPNWIQNTWLDEDTGTSGFKFTNNDFCLVLGSQTNCFKHSVESSQGAISVVEGTSDTEYDITININNGTQTNHYLFKSVSDTKIQIIRPNGINPIYVKQ